MKSFPRQSRSRGSGMATICKSTLGSDITFKANFDFTHTSFKVVQASIKFIAQHTTFFSLHQTDDAILLTMFTEQLPDFLDYVIKLPGFVCLVGNMNIHFDNPL